MTSLMAAGAFDSPKVRPARRSTFIFAFERGRKRGIGDAEGVEGSKMK